MSEEEEQKLRAVYIRYGQEHVFTFWDELSSEQQKHLLAELRTIDVAEMMDMWKHTQDESHMLDTTNMTPVEDDLVESVRTTSPETLRIYEEKALRAMSAGEVGVLLLAGGQGTRLGVNYPKGMYNIGLPSEKTLYQIQVERILRLQQLAQRLTGCAGKITMYIMTSEHTMLPTKEFFLKNNYFGASSEQIMIFEQRTIPAFDTQGKFLMSTKSAIARSPDGNGGLYWALREENILEDLEKRQIRYLHAYCVDNVLVKVADPRFLGFCIHRGVETGNKVVEKRSPSEPVGVVVRIDGKIQVVEYSEISQEKAEQREQDGRLSFRAGNICNHFFSTPFLKRVCAGEERSMSLHIAKKKVPCVDLGTGHPIQPDSANGIKLEKFVFDVFQFSNSFVVWECNREEEFSPLKNGAGSSTDNSVTARTDLISLHRKYLESAGAILSGSVEDAAEISPLVSYSGESLEEYKNQSINLPVHIDLH